MQDASTSTVCGRTQTRAYINIYICWSTNKTNLCANISMLHKKIYIHTCMSKSTHTLTRVTNSFYCGSQDWQYSVFSLLGRTYSYWVSANLLLRPANFTSILMPCLSYFEIGFIFYISTTCFQVYNIYYNWTIHEKGYIFLLGCTLWSLFVSSKIQKPETKLL